MEIVIKNLCKAYGNHTVIHGMDAKFTPGIYGLLGPNGAGKSTFISLLTDSIERTSGEILCDGCEIRKMGEEYRKRFGYMPQQQKMYEDYSGMEFLSYIAVLKGLKGSEAKKQIEELINVVNLWEHRKKKIGSYSGGMKQRIMLAATLLDSPELLILDEPTAGLDPSERINIRNYIAEYAGEKIIIFATHVVSDIECIAKEIIFLKDGMIKKQGTPRELIEEIQGKVGIVSCEYKDINRLQEKYCAGVVSQNINGLSIKVVGDELEENIIVDTDFISLEDVYNYYIRYQN